MCCIQVQEEERVVRNRQDIPPPSGVNYSTAFSAFTGAIETTRLSTRIKCNGFNQVQHLYIGEAFF